jgi:DNA repair protein RadC
MHEVIADLPFDDRPRERMLRHGASTLSDAELVALLLGSGVQGKNAIQLARELLGEGRASLAAQPPHTLAAVRGVGPAKAARVSAAFEFARRYAGNDKEYPPFDAEALGRALVARFSTVRQEILGGVFLDSRHRVLRQQDIYLGTIDHALVSTRDVIRYALQDNTVAIVLFHNHPSGDPSPSGEDIGFTTKMRDSLKLCDLRLVDHVIVGATRFVSMREKGFL